jgi:hypothetical protein
MELIVYIFSASFLFMTAGLLLTWHRAHHAGLLLLALTYCASAVAAIVLTHWWPLVVGFGLVWVWKLLGLDPGRQVPHQGD